MSSETNLQDQSEIMLLLVYLVPVIHHQIRTSPNAPSHHRPSHRTRREHPKQNKNTMPRFISVLLLLIGATVSVRAWTSSAGALVSPAKHTDCSSAGRTRSTRLCMTTTQHKHSERRDFLGASLAAAVLLRPGASFGSYIDPVTDPPKITNRVYLDVEFGSGDEEKGRLVIALYGELMPRTVENFESLCKSNSYAGTTFYRVISDLNVQGGADGIEVTGDEMTWCSFEAEPDNRAIGRRFKKERGQVLKAIKKSRSWQEIGGRWSRCNQLG